MSCVYQRGQKFFFFYTEMTLIIGSLPSVYVERSGLLTKELYSEDIPRFNPIRYYSQYKIQISYNPLNGDTKWLNCDSHPFAGTSIEIGPFIFNDRVSNTGFWFRYRFDELPEIYLSSGNGKSLDIALSATQKAIEKWNTGLETKGSVERMMIRDYIYRFTKEDFKKGDLLCMRYDVFNSFEIIEALERAHQSINEN